MDDADWTDVQALVREWNENPPAELFLRAYFKYEPPSETPQAGDKYFGDDELAAPARTAPSLSEAPADVQAIFQHFISTRKE